MGAWGRGAFANDDALDWVATLEATGVTAIGDTLQAIVTLPADAYLEAPRASKVIAAAEVVAAMRGQPGGDLPPEVVIWLVRHPTPPSAALVRLARTAVARIVRRSELAELWDESFLGWLWRMDMSELDARLAEDPI